MYYSNWKIFLFIRILVSNLFFHFTISTVPPPNDLIVELTDSKWDQIQKGQWLIGFFDKETKESDQLEEDWPVLALKCREQNINVGKVLGKENPGLDVRFVVTTYPKVFYVKNGVAHLVPKASRSVLVDLIKDSRWGSLKKVGFLSNPFSVQMSLISHMFIHTVSLYNYESAIVQKYLPAWTTDIVFGLTFIVCGATLGLLLTVIFDLMRFFLFSSKDSRDAEDDKPDDSDEETKEKDKEDEDSSVRKRK